jgi:hypothetical protein
MIKYSSVEEELEDMTMKTTTKAELDLRSSPWPEFRRFGVNGKLIFANSQIEPHADIVINQETIAVTGLVDVSIILYQSIALEAFYNFAFESVMIG